ncbi:MAG TPA: ChbG/HpnK family deacetylase, partial [Thermoanaerobaculia bacterium]|nr:ChbG/HpnK family deacetylase [Thermoanaerobaculia bacterium]
MKRLIVNADDFGRTPGVTDGTLEAHRNGIVTSATVMVLERAAPSGIRQALERAPRLSLGLHFVMTGGGAPAAAPASVARLAPGGRFLRRAQELPEDLSAEEVRRELQAQIAIFEALAGRPPSHLDSHHHVALHAAVAPIFAQVAREKSLPVRAASDRARDALRQAGVAVPDHFLESFYGEGATPKDLRALLGRLPDGTSELMCHPGYADQPLVAASSYAKEREREVEILCDPALPKLL